MKMLYLLFQKNPVTLYIRERSFLILGTGAEDF